MNIDEKFFDSYMFVSLSLDEVPLLPFVYLIELALWNPMVLWDANHRRGGERINKALGDAESTVEGIPKKNLSKH